MRPDIELGAEARGQIDWPEVIEEYEGSDHAPLREGQDAADLEATA